MLAEVDGGPSQRFVEEGLVLGRSRSGPGALDVVAESPGLRVRRLVLRAALGHHAASNPARATRARTIEPPVEALRRELLEELAHQLSDLRLLLVDWVPPHGPWDDQLAMIFDGGVLSDDDVGRLDRIDEELTGFDFFPPDQVEQLVRPRLWRRLGRRSRWRVREVRLPTSHDGVPITVARTASK